MQVEITAKNQDVVTIEVPPASSANSFFVFGMYKAGSVLQDKVIEDICHELQIPSISIPKSAFKQGVDEGQLSKEAVKDVFNKSGYCFYGFRYLPSYLDGIPLGGTKKLMLIRDPRDMLVSHYFSMKKSHPIPEGDMGEKLLKQRQQLESMDIDSYVLEKAPTFLKLFKGYEKIDDENLALFKYEDIVFEKKQWIEAILSFLGLVLEDTVIEAIAQKHDIFPKQEDASSHIRKVSPGDHKEKLKAETIDQLNDTFASVLEKHGYK